MDEFHKSNVEKKSDVKEKVQNIENREIYDIQNQIVGYIWGEKND